MVPRNYSRTRPDSGKRDCLGIGWRGSIEEKGRANKGDMTVLAFMSFHWMIWGCSIDHLTPLLLQKYRSTKGGHIVIEIGRVYIACNQQEGIPLQKYHDTNAR